MPSTLAIGPEHLEMYMDEEVHDLETLLDRFTPERQFLHQTIKEVPEEELRKEVQFDDVDESNEAVTASSATVGAGVFSDIKMPSTLAIGPEHLEMYMDEEVHDLETLLDRFTPERQFLHHCILKIARSMFGFVPEQLLQEVLQHYAEGKFVSKDKEEQVLLSTVLFIFIEMTKDCSRTFIVIDQPEEWAKVFVKAKIYQLFGQDGCIKALKCIKEFQVKVSKQPPQQDLQLLKIQTMAKLTHLMQLPAEEWEELFNEITKLPPESIKSQMLNVQIKQEYCNRVYLENRDRVTFQKSSLGFKYLKDLEVCRAILMNILEHYKSENEMVWCVEQLLFLPTEQEIESRQGHVEELQKLILSKMKPESSYYFYRVAAKITFCTTQDKKDKCKKALEFLKQASSMSSNLALLESFVIQKALTKKYKMPFEDINNIPNGKLHQVAYLGFVCRQIEAAAELLVDEFLKYPFSPELHMFRSPLLGLKEPVCLIQLLDKSTDKEVFIKRTMFGFICQHSSYLSTLTDVCSEANRLLTSNYALPDLTTLVSRKKKAKSLK